MSESYEKAQNSTTEITLVTGERYCVEGAAKDVEQSILNAARGSIMQLAWFIDADGQNDLAINPEYVVLIRPGAKSQ